MRSVLFIAPSRAFAQICVLLASFVVLPACSQSSEDDADSAGAAGNTAGPAFVEGELLVKFVPGKKAASDAVLAAHDAVVLARLRASGLVQVRVSGDVRAKAAELSADPSVLYAEPNYIVHAIQTIPNDSLFSSLWGLHNTGQTGGTPDADIDAPEAWDISTGSADVLIGVIDTGIDIDHPDLIDNLYVNEAEANGAAGVDDDSNGYIDDVHGINAITDTGNPNDDNGHGTHVSGTIGATGNNGAGVVGVNWNVRIVGCKFLSASGSGSIADAVKCMDYMNALGVKATSNSWGGGGYSQAMKDAIDAADAGGALFIAAAGNDYHSDNDSSPHYPSNYENTNVISVASTDHNDNLSDFSNQGMVSVDVGAPGTDINSTWYGGGYNTIGGTSMATPHVSGLAALIWSQFPDASHNEVKVRMELTVDPLGLPIKTGGRINAYSALTADLSDPFILGASGSTGGGGEALTLSGINFGDEQGTGVVSFTDAVGVATPCPVSAWADEQITCAVPMLPDDSYDVTVTTDAGDMSGAVTFTIIQPLYNEEVAEQQFLGGGVAQGWQALDGCWSYDLPFTFNYYEIDYTSVWICSKGYIDFTSGTVDYTNSPSEMIARTMVAAIWDDIGTSGTGDDIYIHQPTPTTLAIRWDAATYGGSNPVHAEIILDSLDGSIRLNYGPGNTGLTPTVGISEGTGLRYHLAPHDGEPSLTEAQSIVYSRGPGFTLTGTDLTQTTCANNDLFMTVNVNARGGYEDTVALSYVNLPEGLEGVFSDPVITPPGQSAAQVHVGAVESGNYTFGIQGTGTEVADQMLAASFQVFGNVPPVGTLVAPANGEENIPRSPTFTWLADEEVTSYVLEVSLDPQFDTVDYTATVEGTSHQAEVQFPRATQLYWRLRGDNPCGPGLNYEIRSFTTTSAICSAPALNIPVGSPAGVNDSITLTDIGFIEDIDVTLDANHTYMSDLKVTLIHEETGTEVVVLDRKCGGGDNVDATFDDASSIPVGSVCNSTPPAIGGVVKPSNPLSAFNSVPVAGTWTVNAVDFVSVDGGTLNEWCLNVVHNNCGDGIVDEDEQCDDGNDDNTDDCLNSCDLASCGDGFVYDGEEECDDGNDSNGDACLTTCEAASCGDGFVYDGEEECDDAEDNSDTEPDACRTSCVFASCGDSVMDSDEACDEGDANSDTEPDACRTSCDLAGCGDSVTDTGEQCDEGESNSDTTPDACRTTCMDPVCGDAVTDTGEECDDANGLNTDSCLNSCAFASCGDGFIYAGIEECDDANDSNTDGCLNACFVATCGDGFTYAGVEECDDANPSNADGCLTTCDAATCGDGFIYAGVEECDDANGDDTDACPGNCFDATCGDGFTYADVEECDQGEANSDTAPDACRIACILPFCGDDVTDSEEECDYGDDNSDTQPNVCRSACLFAHCGDGVTDNGEDCDDANGDNADACLDTCDAASCGDGFAQADVEDCDDGNDDNGDACLIGCIDASCGDGFIYEDVEDCDDGDDNSDDLADACRMACLLASCGDGVTDTGETCDAGDLNSGEAEATCGLECALPTCGNGVVDDGEECDEGDLNSNTLPDACRTTCTLSYCGDGVVDSVETCDAGVDRTTSSECSAVCSLATCGDGVLDTGEQCDDGEANADTGDATCRSRCVLPRCGDGIQDSTLEEGCDDGYSNSDTADACRTVCEAPTCGDGIIDTGESCDEGDANSNEADATCRADCALSTCGDGITDSGEQCDDGLDNSDSPDACRSTCSSPACGDGILDSTEDCDDGDANSDTGTDSCRTDCIVAYCGDGVVDSGESCDDGAANSDDNADTCRTDCAAPTCGDDVLDDGEECDLGDDNGDDSECSSACIVNSSDSGCSVLWVSPGRSNHNALVGFLVLVGVALRRRRRA